MALYHLYSSEGCHLCEQAYELCFSILAEQMVVVDIVDDENLVEQYGMHIPVLKNLTSGQQLFWPFNREQIQTFINS